MSTPTITPRFPFEAQIAKLPPEVQEVHRTSWNAIADLQAAIPELKSQIDAKSGTISSTTTTNETVQTGTVITNDIFFGGTVNDQTGETLYQTQQSDNGAMVILDDASPVSVVLNAVVSLPFWVFIVNQGASVVTATPLTGVINYAGNVGVTSLPIPSGCFAIVGLDSIGTFWAATLPQGMTVTVTTAALTSGGTQGSMRFIGGILVSQTQAT